MHICNNRYVLTKSLLDDGSIFPSSNPPSFFSRITSFTGDVTSSFPPRTARKRLVPRPPRVLGFPRLPKSFVPRLAWFSIVVGKSSLLSSCIETILDAKYYKKNNSYRM